MAFTGLILLTIKEGTISINNTENKVPKLIHIKAEYSDEQGPDSHNRFQD